jgi:hypothetical protein
MATLPTPGGDEGTWGDELNEWLLVEHATDGTHSIAASSISIVDAADDFTATDVEAALAELQADHEADATALTNHIGDASAAHAASAISFSATGSISGTDVQAAVAEVASEAASALTTHAADTSSLHGITDTSVLLTTATKLDDLAAPDDNTDLNASESTHGLLPKLSGSTVEYLRGDGTWETPATGAFSGDAGDIVFTPVGGLSATDVQAAIAELDTEKQPLDTELTALATVTSAADIVPYYTGSGAAAGATVTAFARTLLDDANAGAALTTLGAASSSDLSTHAADTSSVHGIADTSALATSSDVSTAVSNHSSDTTSVHGIADTSALATATDISTHNSDTTSVHGIADTSALATTTDLSTHASDTSSVHGIADTSVLLTTATKLDDLAAPEDNTDLNASASAHGLLPKLPNDAAKVLLGDGSYGYAPLYAATVPTANYTLVAGDAGKLVEMDVAAGCTVTIPTNASVAFPVGTVVGVFQYGAGQVTVTPASGATVVSPSAKVKLTGQFSSGALRKRATDEWVLTGDITS